MLAWDSHGRIRLSDEMLDHARVSRELVLLATLHGFEIWSWDVYTTRDQERESAESIQRALRAVGL